MIIFNNKQCKNYFNFVKKKSSRVEPELPIDTLYIWVEEGAEYTNQFATLTKTPTSSDYIYVTEAGEPYNCGCDMDGTSSQTLGDTNLQATVSGNKLTIGSTNPPRVLTFSEEHSGLKQLTKMWMNESDYTAFVTKGNTINTDDSEKITVYRYSPRTQGARDYGYYIGTNCSYDSETDRIILPNNNSLTPMNSMWISTDSFNDNVKTEKMMYTWVGENSQNVLFTDTLTPTNNATRGTKIYMANGIDSFSVPLAVDTTYRCGQKISGWGTVEYVNNGTEKFILFPDDIITLYSTDRYVLVPNVIQPTVSEN